MGHVQLYGESGREGGATETGTASIDEVPRALTKGTIRLTTPVDAARNSRPSRGGAVSYAPPPTPEPSTTSRTCRGGKPSNRGTQESNQGQDGTGRQSVIRADGG